MGRFEVLGAALVAGLVLSGCAKKEDVGFRTGPVDRGSVSVSVSATGTLEALVTVEVGSQLSGQLIAIPVDFNQPVRAGQLLARLDPATFAARVRQAQADYLAREASVESANAALARAVAAFARSESLIETGFASTAALDQARAERDQAQAQVSLAKAQLAQASAALAAARTDLERTEIRSPISGVVVGKSVDVGQTVAASFQAPVLFTIAQDLSKMRVELKVDEADIGQVKEGARARFTVDAFPDRTFEAAVEQVRISPQTVSNVVTYVVTLVTDNPDRKLLPGMTANAEIIVEERENVLRVPSAALRFRPTDEKLLAKAEALSGNAKPAQAGPGQGRPGAPNPAAGPAGQGGQSGQGGQGGQGRGPGGGLAAALDLDEAQQKQLRSLMQAAFQEAQAEGGDRRKAIEAAFRKLEPSLRPDQKEKLAQFRAQRAREAAGAVRPAVVWRLVKGEPSPVAVQVGLADSTNTVLVGDALKEGDEVIVSGPPPKNTSSQAPRPPGAFGGAPGGGRR